MKLLYVITFFLFPLGIFSQTHKSFSWTYGMLNYTSFFRGKSGIGIEGGYNYVLKKSNYYIGGNIRSSGEIIIFTTPSLTHTECNFIIGTTQAFSKGQAYLQSGIGVGFGNVRGKLLKNETYLLTSTYEKKKYVTYNIPIELGILFDLKNFGLGLKTFYSYNPYNPLLGIGISLGYNFIKAH